MRVVIVGHHLPGRTCPQPDGVLLTNVHVGLQRRSDPVDLVRGDAAGAWWQLDVEVVAGAAGELDFRGPAVHGKRGDRFVYLTWGDVGLDGSFAMFRRAKLMLNRIDRSVIAAAQQPGATLIGTIHLTDDRGHPRCARVDPPALVWSAASGSLSPPTG